MNGKAEFLDVKGLPIGALDDSVYSEMEFNFKTGDKLVVYTDGLCELRNSEDQMYSDARFLNVLSTNKSKNITEIIDILNSETLNWCGSEQEIDDDITILAIERVT